MKRKLASKMSGAAPSRCGQEKMGVPKTWLRPEELF
jgi:hypothetical protein